MNYFGVVGSTGLICYVLFAWPARYVFPIFTRPIYLYYMYISLFLLGGVCVCSLDLDTGAAFFGSSRDFLLAVAATSALVQVYFLLFST